MDMTDWCKCEEETDDCLFHDDGVAPESMCPGKHRWHCGLCGKLNQVG